MKNILFLMLIFSVFLTKAQNPIEYEKEILSENDYFFENMTFGSLNDENIISGTLIKPKDEFRKIIVIVPGTGYNLRNNHYMLAEEFLKNNIAVFRFDERRKGDELENTTSDLFSIVSHFKDLPELRNKKLGLLGHSLGGFSTIEIYEKLENNIDFLIQWSSPVEKYGAFIKYQIKNGISNYNRMLIADNVDDKIKLIGIIHKIIGGNQGKTLNELYALIVKATKNEGFKRKQFKYYVSYPHVVNIIKKNFEEVYKNITIPVLYVIGSNDQLIDSQKSTELLKSYGNKNIKIAIVKGLNHFLNDIDLKEMDLEKVYHIDPKAANIMTTWVGSLQ